MSIDGADIDRDHKFMFALSERILCAAKRAVQKEVLDALLTEFVDYVAIHFANEERHMAEVSYPDKDMHKVSHDKYFGKLCEVKRRFDRGEPDTQVRLIAFVGAYSFDHIHVYDRAFADWCRCRKRRDGNGAPCLSSNI